MSRLSALACLASALLLTACPKPPGGGGPTGTRRCEVDLAATGLFSQAGAGASAKVVDSDAMLIGGQGATGRLGDVLLQNDKVRVIIEQPGRTVGPILSGGHIVDADLQRNGQPGRDIFGRMGLIYMLGRLSNVDKVEVLADGSAGGPAVVASTGHDGPHNLINLQQLLSAQAGLAVQFVVDPGKPVPLRSTTYYVLSPGETRVRALTAFCNDGDAPLQAPLVELMDVGAFELFLPGGCTNGLGTPRLDVSNSCMVSPSPWYGTQGDGVAYALRSSSLTDLKKPTTDNAVLGYGGVVGAFIDAQSLNGILSWTDASATTRPGSFIIKAGAQRSYLRDFFIGADLADVTGALLAVDGAARGTVEVAATLPGGAPAAGARVSVEDAAGKMVTLMVADQAGHARATLAPGDYTLSAGLEGHLVGPAVPFTVTAGGTATAAATLPAARTLTVTVADPVGAPMPGKVTVTCPGGCAFNADTYQQHVLIDAPVGGAAAIGYVGASGQLALALPPGEYDVVVTRGPEYSAWPDTWPASGARVDLRTADQAVHAVLGHVVDSTGWMSADLHVHAQNSSDSAVANEQRVGNFLAEGVDVLLSTDHDAITDFGPTVRAMNAERFMATMIGAEVTSFTHGHFNNFPLVLHPDKNLGGPFDHAGGESGPTYRLGDLFPAIKAANPGAVGQLNHPRGRSGGVLTMLKVDTATLATHGDPADYNMEPAPDATADDTKLLGDTFDIIETANGTSPSFAVLNDWMTFLSRGTVRTASGVSDTHTAYSSNGGYARTYAKVGVDEPAAFTATAFADAMRTHQAFVTNGPYLKVTARKVDAAGQPAGAPVEVGGTVSLSPAAGEGLELTVDVQGPDYLTFDRVELYSHAPGREAVNGESNSTWPDGRILDKHLVDPAALPLEPVPGMNGLNLRKVHLTDRFVVHPAKDTWYVVMVRSTAGRSMWPLHGDRAVAYSNAVLVDADGSGKYDDFPLKPGQPLRVPPAPRRAPQVPTAAQLDAAIRLLLSHKHE